MRVYISSDIEGVAGVVDWGHSIPGAPEYGRARRLMTAEVNAAAVAAFNAGAETVLVNDSHGPMNNILIEELDERIELVTGRPKALTMVHGVGDGFDLAMFLGYHAKAGTAGGVLEHSYAGMRVFDITLNGRSYGEFGLNAMLAGYRGVPVVLASGASEAGRRGDRRQPAYRDRRGEAGRQPVRGAQPDAQCRSRTHRRGRHPSADTR